MSKEINVTNEKSKELKVTNSMVSLTDRVEILEKNLKRTENNYFRFQRVFEEKFDEFNRKEKEHREFKIRATIIQITQTVIIMALIALHLFH